VAALRPFQQQRGHTGRDEDGRRKLRNARNLANGIGRLRTIFSDSPIGGSIPRSFARMYRNSWFALATIGPSSGSLFAQSNAA